MFVFNYFEGYDVFDNFCLHFNLDKIKTRNYLLNIDNIHVAYSKMVEDLNINLLTPTDNCLICCRHITTGNDSLNSIKKYGLLKLDEVLEQETPLRKFLLKNKISISPTEKMFTYGKHRWYINSLYENCNPCPRGRDICGNVALCDYREMMGRLHNKLYHDKSEIEFFIGGDSNDFRNYTSILDAPEILIDIAKILKSMMNNISEYYFQFKWKRLSNWQRYLLSFSIPYNWLEMNIDRKTKNFYFDFSAWFNYANFNYDDYVTDNIPILFYHNIHIAENCLNKFFYGEPLNKFGQLLPNYHVSYEKIDNIKNISSL